MNNKSFLFGILGVLFFILGTILAGFQFENYSHISQLISESYAIGTHYGISLRFFIFLPSGFFIALFAFLSINVLPKSTLTKIGLLGIGIFYGIATIIVSIFPCDAGCNKELIDPSLSQIIHNLTGFLTYTIVPICLILVGISARKWTNGKQVFYVGIVCGIISFIFVSILFADLKSEFVGLYQRIIEASILLWIFTCSFYVKGLKKK